MYTCVTHRWIFLNTNVFVNSYDHIFIRSWRWSRICMHDIVKLTKMCVSVSLCKDVSVWLYVTMSVSISEMCLCDYVCVYFQDVSVWLCLCLFPRRVCVTMSVSICTSWSAPRCVCVTMSVWPRCACLCDYVCVYFRVFQFDLFVCVYVYLPASLCDYVCVYFHWHVGLWIYTMSVTVCVTMSVSISVSQSVWLCLCLLCHSLCDYTVCVTTQSVWLCLSQFICVTMSVSISVSFNLICLYVSASICLPLCLHPHARMRLHVASLSSSVSQSPSSSACIGAGVYKDRHPPDTQNIFY